MLRPAKGVTIAANGLWLKTRVIDYVGTNAAGQPENFDGAEFIYRPRFQGSIVAAYATPVSDTLNVNGAVSLRYQGKSNTIFEADRLSTIASTPLVHTTLLLKPPARRPL